MLNDVDDKNVRRTKVSRSRSRSVFDIQIPVERPCLRELCSYLVEVLVRFWGQQVEGIFPMDGVQ